MALVKPNEVEAEKEILAACFTGGTLKTGDVITLTVGNLSPAHFAHPDFKEIFVALQEAVADSEPDSVEWGDVRSYIGEERASRNTLKRLVTEVKLTSVTENTCNRMIKKLNNAYRGRKLYELSKSIETDALAGNADDAFNALSGGLIELARDRFEQGARKLDDYLPDVHKEIDERRLAEGGVVGYRTGIAPIDYVWKGIQKKNLYFIAARPGHGKSIAIGQIFYELSRRYPKLKILLATTEMDTKQYLTRIASTAIGLDYDDYTGGKYSEEQAKLLHAAIADMSSNKVVINEDGYQDSSSLRQDIIWSQADILLVDYAQEFYPDKPKNNEYADVTAFIRQLNAMKKTFNIGIVAALQLSRAVEQRPIDERRPIPSDTRATGWIEQAADAMFGLYRPVEYAVSEQEYDGHTDYFDGNGDTIDPTIMEWVCLKNRHGKKRDVMTYLPVGSMLISNEPVQT